jgi:urease accessory protein
LLGLAAVSGLLTATAVMLPPLPLVAIGTLAGIAIGLDSAQQELVGSGLLAALLGTGLSAGVAVLYLFVFAEWFSRYAWQRIGLRVLGSWGAAAALLVGVLQLAAEPQVSAAVVP